MWRAAVLEWMTPFLAVLSRSGEAAARAFRAASGSDAVLTFLMAVLSADRMAWLRRCALCAVRMRFLEDFRWANRYLR